MLLAELNKIRKPKEHTKGTTAATAAACLVFGIALGLFAKWLDNLGLDSGIWWHRLIEKFDLGNFFSDIAIWLLLALAIAVFSASAMQAAVNVFVFFAGMCAAYHLYTVLFAGFNPASYMMLWYGITILSPLLAAFCWYARGTGAAAIILDIGIMSIFTVSCFAIGFIYINVKGILYVLVYVAAAAILYTSPRQLLIMLPLGFFLSFLVHPIWPFY